MLNVNKMNVWQRTAGPGRTDEFTHVCKHVHNLIQIQFGMLPKSARWRIRPGDFAATLTYLKKWPGLRHCGCGHSRLRLLPIKGNPLD